MSSYWGREHGRARHVAKVVPFIPRNTIEMKPQGMTLRELWARWWLEKAPGTAESTRKNYRRVEALSKILPDYPTPGDIATWLAGLLSSGNAPKTVEQRKSVLQAIYTYGLAAGYCLGNPAAICPWRIPPEKAERAILEIESLFPSLLAVCRDARERAFLGFMRYSGARKEEALALTPTDFFRGSNPWFLQIVRQRAHPNSMLTRITKGREGRQLEVRPELAELLAPVLELPPVQMSFGTRGMPRSKRVLPFIFPYREHELGDLRLRLFRVAPDHFGPGNAWHVFRHTVASELFNAGTPIEMISSVLGHRSIKTTEKYIRRVAGTRTPAGVWSKLYKKGPGHADT